MAALSKGQAAFVSMLREKRVGDIITRDEVLQATGWRASTFKTHLHKNAFAPFIQQVSVGRFRLLVDGASISDDSFRDAATQVRPTQLSLNPEDELKGAGTYVLKQKLGEGAVGHVWKAKHSESGQLVAVKVMLPKHDLLAPTSIANVARRFYRESRNGATLNHASLVRHFDRGLFKGNPFLVMELARESLADRLKQEGPLNPSDAIAAIAPILNALEYLHARDNIHRDVKPANILICDRGYVLGDLGIVKWSDLNDGFISAGTITRSTVQLGSWFYMAPEQLESPHEAVPASDIYALGVSWLEILTGTTSTPAQIGAKKFGS